MNKTKPEIRVVIESSTKLKVAYEDLDNFLIALCQKYELNYYELFGLIESAKLNYNEELNKAVEEE